MSLCRRFCPRSENIHGSGAGPALGSCWFGLQDSGPLGSASKQAVVCPHVLEDLKARNCLSSHLCVKVPDLCKSEPRSVELKLSCKLFIFLIGCL